jgi:antirestriction protein ArdC
MLTANPTSDAIALTSRRPPREDHAAYIANWLDVLTADNRAIFAAASHAALQPASAPN